MPFYRYGNLANYLDTHRMLSERLTIEIFIQILYAIKILHSIGIIHVILYYINNKYFLIFFFYSYIARYKIR